MFFQSLRSSSGGNCLAVWTPTSSILIDCGVKRQYECRELVDDHRRRTGSLDGVVVSHAHGDHMSYASLRVLQRVGLCIHGHKRVVRQLRDRHALRDWSSQPELVAFSDEPFTVGDFQLLPIEVPHAPDIPTFGFVIREGRGRAARKIVVCTDLHDYAAILSHLVDADFVFIEANHDLELLRKHPNPNSRYHLNNVKTGWLLYHALRQSGSPPRAVMLGHLSEERNSKRIAIDEVRRVFARQGMDAGFDLDAAPAHHPSTIVEV